MKKYLPFLILIAISGTCFAQRSNPIGVYAPWHLSISDCVDCDSPHYYIVGYDQQGHHKEAHVITQDFFVNDTCEITVRQVDAQGLPELIIKSEIHAGGWIATTGLSQIRIWNLDTKKEMFVAIYDYYAQSQKEVYGNGEEGPSDTIPAIIRSDCVWHYDMDVADRKITISHLKVMNEYAKYDDEIPGKIYEKHILEDCPPDHDEGIYTLRDGEFVKQPQQK